jgi:hypothetical protein
VPINYYFNPIVLIIVVERPYLFYAGVVSYK